MLLWISRILLVLGWLLILGGIAYGGVVGYFVLSEGASSSTQRVLVLKDGRRIPLVQPTQPGLPNLIEVRTTPPQGTPAPQRTPLPTIIALHGQGDQGDSTRPNESATPVPQQPLYVTPLPPLRVRSAAISMDWPVVLNDGVNLPRFKGVGWFLGSAFPGLPGNMVLFGHLDGPNSTFGRLKELKVGDEFSVVTDEREHRYKVQSSFETTYDDVGVLAPTDTVTATLITCSGRWDNLRQDYTHRLIVKAVYVGQLAIK